MTDGEPLGTGAERSAMERADYLAVTYSVARAPYGPYPGMLARYLHETWFSRPGRLLDLGCGRGEYLDAFAKLGHETSGIDISPIAAGFSPSHSVALVDLERDPMPYPAGSFDYVFSKSVVEHLHHPVTVLEKVRSVLKPGGIAVIMTPSWIHNAWGPFYIDHTHVTPFTIPSLRDCFELVGLETVAMRHLRQLPFLWRYQWLEPLVALFSKIPLPYRPMHDVDWPLPVNKFIRFSKEVMILGVARRPGASSGP